MRNAMCETEEMDTPAKRLRWARENRSNYDTATKAALAHGWTVSTYLGHENGDRNPSRTAAKRYGDAYRVPWVWILEGGPIPDGKRGKAALGSVAIPTKGEVAAGRWLDLDLPVNPQDLEQFPITSDPRFPPDAQYVLTVRDTSLDRVAKPGDGLHCLDLRIATTAPSENELVIVERRRDQERRRELTAKRIRRRGQVTILTAESFDRRWKAIEVDDQ